MATAGSALAGAGGGAAAGSAILPGWGTAIGAGIGLLGSLFGGDGGAAEEQRIAENQLQNAQNQQAYARSLNAEALKRASAGSTDAYGSSLRYDPATNQWVTALGAIPASIQNSENAATLLHNNVDMPQAVQNNAAASVIGSLARRGLSGAMNNLTSYRDITPQTELGALQDASTRANQMTQEPLIQDTLRSFARSGTAAGPVLGRMGRDNALALSQEMDKNVIDAQTGAAGVNTANRQNLAAPIAALGSLANPNMSFATGTTTNPAGQLSAQTQGRAVASGQPASSGAGYSAYGTIAGNQAANSAIAAAGNSPFTAQFGSIGRQAGNLFDAVTGTSNDRKKSIADQVLGWFGSGGSNAGNRGDQPSSIDLSTLAMP